MATPPRVTDQRLSETMLRAVNRRIKVADPDRERCPNPQVSDPRELLDYLYRHTRVPQWVLQADVSDALVLNTWLWWQDRRRELSWLKLGRQRGLFLTQLGAPFGIQSRRGVLDRIDRLEALLRYDRPNEKVSRIDRAAARQAEVERDQRQVWIDQHHQVVVDVADGLLVAMSRFDVDERDWLYELANDMEAGQCTPGTMTILAMAADEVRTDESVAALAEGEQPHGVHRVLARADELAADYAALR